MTFEVIMEADMKNLWPDELQAVGTSLSDAAAIPVK
jgi:hypothetical protein